MDRGKTKYIANAYNAIIVSQWISIKSLRSVSNAQCASKSQVRVQQIE
jgi:hypothetical protein